MAHRSPCHGFTLLEMLVVLAIGTVLLTQASVAITRLLAGMAGETQITRVHGALQFTRTVAVAYNQAAVLCPIDVDGRCSGRWSEGFAVFIDADGDAHRSAAEPILKQFEGPAEGHKLRFGAFRTNRYLRFLPNGQTDWQNGRFTWCPPANMNLQPRSIVINVQGRARRAHRVEQDAPCG